MVDSISDSVGERLQQAEMAEREVQRLQPLADEAPQLRVQNAKALKDEARRRAKDQAVAKARAAVDAGAELQERVPELLGNAHRAVVELYNVFKEINSHRRKASEGLAIADRVDYDAELADGEEHERALGRDTRGLAYALATRHGELKVKQLMEELDPGFNILKGCNLDHPISRDIAQFVMGHAIPNEASSSTVVSENAPARPETSEPDQRQQATVSDPVTVGD